MERIVAGEVVSAVGRANAFITIFMSQLEHGLVEMGGLAEGKRKVPHSQSDGLLQFFAGHDDLFVELPRVFHSSQVDMTPRMSADLDPLGRHRPDFGDGIRPPLAAAGDIMWEWDPL